MTDTPSDSPAVLIVEDERSLADLYEVWLADSCAVRTVHSGQEALDVLDGSFDVVLLDRRMPGVSGDDVLSYVRNEGLDVRVVMVTAVTPTLDVIDMDLDEYLVKPVGKDELCDAVERMMSRTRESETMRELTRLLAKKGALESELSYSELRQHEKYRRLQQRIDELRSEIERGGEVEESRIEALFRDPGDGRT